MSSGLGAVCDDFYANCRLFLKLDMTLERETVLHFFDRIRKEYPRLKRLRRHDDNCLVLEEDPDEDDSRRWIRLDTDSLRFGIYSPASVDEITRFGDLLLTQAPFHLTFSDLDYDHLEFVFGFDLEYRGNHDQLIADTFYRGADPGGFFSGEDVAHVIDAQPYFGIAMTPDCDLQAYVEVKSRTSTYEIRHDAYEGDPITIFLTLRKYWGVNEPPSPADAYRTLIDVAADLATETIVPQFVNPARRCHRQQAVISKCPARARPGLTNPPPIRLRRPQTKDSWGCARLCETRRSCRTGQLPRRPSRPLGWCVSWRGASVTLGVGLRAEYGGVASDTAPFVHRPLRR